MSWCCTAAHPGCSGRRSPTSPSCCGPDAAAGRHRHARPNPHVAFGAPGPHFCAGAHLARLAIGVAYEEIVSALPPRHLTRTRNPMDVAHCATYLALGEAAFVP